MSQYTAPIPPSGNYPDPESLSIGDTYIDTTNGREYEYTSLGWQLVATDELDVDWYGERHDEKYQFKLVSWEAWRQEIESGEAQADETGEELTNITGGTVSLSALSDLKATCEFTFEGGDPPDPNMLVRIYYTFTDKNGRTLSFSNSRPKNRPAVLGTFFPIYNDITYEEDFTGTDGTRKLKMSGSVTGQSVLSVILNKRVGFPWTMPAETPLLGFADAKLKELGIRTNNPLAEYNGVSPSVSKHAHTFEPDDPIVTVVNWCLRNSAPRFQAVYPDPYGRAVLAKYVERENTPDIAKIPKDNIFTTDQFSIVQRGIVSDNDWQTTPNVCRLSYSNEEISLFAISKNVSGAKFSLLERGGREITVQGDVEELAGASDSPINPEEMRVRLGERALYRLQENSSEIEHTVFTHAYLGWLHPNDPVMLDYVEPWVGYIMNMDITLAPSTQCQTKIRRYLSNPNIVYETVSRILWYNPRTESE